LKRRGDGNHHRRRKTTKTEGERGQKQEKTLERKIEKRDKSYNRKKRQGEKREACAINEKNTRTAVDGDDPGCHCVNDHMVGKGRGQKKETTKRNESGGGRRGTSQTSVQKTNGNRKKSSGKFNTSRGTRRK